MITRCECCGFEHDSYEMESIGGYRGFAEDPNQHTGRIVLCVDCVKKARLTRHEFGFTVIDLDAVRGMILEAVTARQT